MEPRRSSLVSSSAAAVLVCVACAATEDAAVSTPSPSSARPPVVSEPAASEPAASKPSAAQPVAETERFAFHSDELLNLHHFLFQWARGEAGWPGGRPVPVAESEADVPVEPDEGESWREALEIYRGELVERDLLFDEGMTAIKSALAEGDEPDALGAAVPEPVASALSLALPVYRRHFWEAHDRANRDWIAGVAAQLERHEARLARGMARAYGGSWGPERIRVDVCAYANWAEAYTTNDPTHVVLSSTDPDHAPPGALEIVVHEASHSARMARPLRAELAEVFSGRGASPDRNLWHVFLFVTSGHLVGEALAADGIEDYEPYGERTGLYDRGWRAMVTALETHWTPCLRGELQRAEALSAIAEDLLAP